MQLLGSIFLFLTKGYQQDYGLQQLKIQQQQAQTAAETSNSKGGGNQSIAAPVPNVTVAAAADQGILSFFKFTC